MQYTEQALTIEKCTEKNLTVIDNGKLVDPLDLKQRDENEENLDETAQ